MNKLEQLEYWKQKFTSLDLYNNYEHEIEVVDQQELIVYRFVKDKDRKNVTALKLIAMVILNMNLACGR